MFLKCSINVLIVVKGTALLYRTDKETQTERIEFVSGCFLCIIPKLLCGSAFQKIIYTKLLSLVVRGQPGLATTRGHSSSYQISRLSI